MKKRLSGVLGFSKSIAAMFMTIGLGRKVDKRGGISPRKNVFQGTHICPRTKMGLSPVDNGTACHIKKPSPGRGSHDRAPVKK